MNYLRSMSIKYRFYGLLVLLFTILVIAGVFIVSQTKQLSEITNSIHNHPLEVSNAALKSSGEIIKIHRSMKDVVLSENEIELHAAVQKVIENEAETYRNLDLIKIRILEKEGKSLEREARDLFEAWKPIRDEVILYAINGEYDKASFITKHKGAEHVKKLERKFDQLYKYARSKADEFKAQSQETSEKNVHLITAVIIFVFILISSIIFITYKSVVDDLETLKIGMNNIVDSKVLDPIELEGENEIVEMSNDFNTLIKMLKVELWKKESINNIQNQLIGNLEFSEMLDGVVSSIVQDVEGVVGALFLYKKKEKRLKLCSSYAFAKSENYSGEFKLGEGIIGQVGLQMSPILLNDTGKIKLVINKGTNSGFPLNTFTFPIRYENTLYGVLEIGSDVVFTDNMQEYLIEVGRVLGAYLISVEQKEKINGLLLEANEAKEKFKEQSEVVDKINNELKERQYVLESKSKELNNLNVTLEEKIQEKTFLEDELRSLNEELEVTVYERTLKLQESNIELQKTNAVLEEEIQAKSEIAEELRESEQRFRLAIQDSPVPIMLHAEDGEVLAISNAWTEMTGYAIEDIPTTDIWTFKAYGERNLNVKKVIESLFELGERQYDGEFDVNTIDGDARTWGFYSTPIGKIADKRRIVMSVAVDVTEQKQFEKDLLIAMEEAKESAVLKSKFLANMSHEIRTPMNGIIGMLEVLNMTELKKEQVEYLKMIKSSTKSLLHILNDILDYSKIEAGKIEIQNKRFNLREVIVRVVSIFTPLSHERQLTLESEITETVPEFLFGDEDRIQQILSNLVGNALKFTENGKVSIKATVIHQDSEYSTIKFTVSDTGRGIKKSDLTKIFDRFNQVDENGNNKKNGTGLGLSISKGLVEMMNGSIKVESEYNVGTDFSFELSLKHLGAESVLLTVEKSEIEKVLKKSKILIVEDDHVSSKMLKILLAKNGYKSILAKSGEEALRLFKKGGLELVLMDINLPGISGFEATRKMKQHDQLHGKSTPVIAMTANALNGDREKCIEAGMDDYLTKPIELEEFFEKLRKYY